MLTDAELVRLRLKCFDRFRSAWEEEGWQLDQVLDLADDLVAWSLLGQEPSEIRTMVDGDL